MGRAPCCDKANVKRGPWSPDEDATLKRYVETHGTGGNWISLPQKAGLKRCGKSCRLRWLNYLRPDIKHGGFTEAEDNIICSLYNQMGSRWSLIASQLPGRTDNDVKNYWNTKLKKKHFAASRIPPPLIPEPSVIPVPKPEPGFSYYPVLSDSDYGILSSVTNLSPTNNILFPSPEPGQFGVPSSEDSETMAAVDGILGDFGGFEFSYDLVNGMWSGGGGGTVQEDQKAGPGAGGGTAPIFPC